MDRRAEYRPPEEKSRSGAENLPHARYSEENRDRVEKLLNAGLSTKTANLLARKMETDGPILTDQKALSRLSDGQILSIRGIGPMSLREIREVAPQVDSEF